MRIDLGLMRARDVIVVVCLILLALGIANAAHVFPFGACQ